MKFFFSCDWGTSAFRLRLVAGENATVLSEIKTNYGIAAAFEAWKKTNRQENNRLAFYQAYLFEQLQKITPPANTPSGPVPILLSGMASSGIGMMELPYKKLPFHCSGTDLILHAIPAKNDQQPKIIIVSGVMSAVDVIRGEETMLVGCDILMDDTERLFIFPGTHSKHIRVKDGAAGSIATYMTGELFDLLSNKSILSTSVKKNDGEEIDNGFFVAGVIKGNAANLANSLFNVRTNQLFKKATPAENYEYLSGILIGNELRDIAESKPASITLVCAEGLKNAYLQALDVLGLNKSIRFKNADEALVKGQWKILQQLELA